MSNILVAHPGRQHSHQLARAFQERGRLLGYWTGVPAARPESRGPLYRLLARLSPQPTVDLPGRVVRHNYVMPLARRVAETVFGPSRAVVFRHRAAAWFDAWAARELPAEADVVVGYENAARKLFTAARRQGAVTILDAASFHHRWQDAFYEPVEGEAEHRRITQRKDEEIELADHVLTVSELARESYLDAGLSPDRVTAVPMGADLSDFSPPAEGTREPSHPVRFLFAGHAGRRKGADLLLAASEHVAREWETDHRVQFAGETEEALFRGTGAPVERLGYLSRPELADAFRRANCLVLPSRHDSFGRVVVEGMACGLPVIVSEHVGARELVREGETGWVVPAGDAEALAERMRWCVEHAGDLSGMSEAAVETARRYSWEAYRERMVEVIDRVIESVRAEGRRGPPADGPGRRPA